MLAATGFSANEQVSVTFTDFGGHQNSVTLTADANGKVTGSIAIPTLPLPAIGFGSITATGLSSSRTASTVFVVTPG